MISKWHLLSLPTTVTNVPPLLAKFEHALTGYKIILTDLTNIWSESLDRQEILRRAFDQDTSIDPSEDADQFGVLLDRLRQGLGNPRGPDGSILQLQYLGGRNLILRISFPLPAPLRPLDWRFHLSPAEPIDLTTEFVMPLLQGLAVQARRTESLLACINEKDHVLSKLVDKLDSSGVDVGSIFLSAAGHKTGRKAVTWEQAGSVVKGLDAFDEQEWKHDGERNDQPAMDFNEVLCALFSASPLSTAFELGRVTTVSRDWWVNLVSKAIPTTDRLSPASGMHEIRRTAAKPQGKPDVDRNNNGDSEDEFQKGSISLPVRATFAKPSEHPSVAAHCLLAAVDDMRVETDADTSNEDSPNLAGSPCIPSKSVSHGQNLRASPSLSTPLKKLGAIGGKRESKLNAFSEGLNQAPKLTDNTRAAIVFGKQEKRPEGISDAEGAAEAAPRTTPSIASKATNRLGKIGGIKNSMLTEILEQTCKDNSSQDLERTHQVNKKKGTKIDPTVTQRGGLLISETQADRLAVPEASQERPRTSPKTPRQNPDHRREELKRQLESQSHVLIKKKKRKF